MKFFTLLICIMASQVCLGVPDEYLEHKASLLSKHQISKQTFDTLTRDLDLDQKTYTLKHLVTLKIPSLKRDDLACLMDLIGHAKKNTRPFVTHWIQKVFPPEGQNLTSYFAPVREILMGSNAGLLIRLSEKIALVQPTAADHMALLTTMGSITPQDPDHVMKYVFKVLNDEHTTTEDAQTLVKTMTTIPKEDRSPLITISKQMGLLQMEVSDRIFLLNLLNGTHPTQRGQVLSCIPQIMPLKNIESFLESVVPALHDPKAEKLIEGARLLFVSHKKREPNPYHAYDKMMYRNFLAALWKIAAHARIDAITRTRTQIKDGMTHMQVLKILNGEES